MPIITSEEVTTTTVESITLTPDQTNKEGTPNHTETTTETETATEITTVADEQNTSPATRDETQVAAAHADAPVDVVDPLAEPDSPSNVPSSSSVAVSVPVPAACVESAAVGVAAPTSPAATVHAGIEEVTMASALAAVDTPSDTMQAEANATRTNPETPIDQPHADDNTPALIVAKDVPAASDSDAAMPVVGGDATIASALTATIHSRHREAALLVAALSRMTPDWHTIHAPPEDPSAA